MLDTQRPYGLPPSLAAAFTERLQARQLSDCFKVNLGGDGGVIFTHTSGSQVIFKANGDIELVPARDFVVDPARMMRVATSEEEALRVLAAENAHDHGC